MARDNTVSFARLSLQIERQRWRSTLAGCRVTVYEHLDATLSVGYGAHVVGRYNSVGEPLEVAASKDDLAAKPKTTPRRAA